MELGEVTVPQPMSTISGSRKNKSTHLYIREKTQKITQKVAQNLKIIFVQHFVYITLWCISGSSLSFINFTFFLIYSYYSLPFA